MEQLESLKRRLHTTRDLQSVVKTMKALSAVNIRHYEQAAESLGVYSQTIEKGLQSILKFGPPELIPQEQKPADSLGAIVYGSDQGMVGKFNEQLAAFTLQEMAALNIGAEKRTILCVGRRTESSLRALGQRVDRSLPTSTSLNEVLPLLYEILQIIQQWRLADKLDMILLFYNRSRQKTGYSPEKVLLFPLARHWLMQLKEKKWPSRSLPLFRLSWEELFSSFIQGYILNTLLRGFIESLASENASRLAAMQAAEKNIEENIEQLGSLYNRLRQNAITSELLDISAGFEALK